MPSTTINLLKYLWISHTDYQRCSRELFPTNMDQVLVLDIFCLSYCLVVKVTEASKGICRMVFERDIETKLQERSKGWTTTTVDWLSSWLDCKLLVWESLDGLTNQSISAGRGWFGSGLVIKSNSFEDVLDG